MRRSRVVMTVLVAASALAFGQSGIPSATQNGVTNMVYSTTVHLDSYVGQFVTLSGNQSAKPSTDGGTGRPMPHFIVLEVQPASGKCK